MKTSFPYQALLLITLGHTVLLLGVATHQDAPGYMDAAYYAVLGRRLAQGQGLTEPFLWTYLRHPAPPPRPGHDYWMPLPSLLAALGTQMAFWTSHAYARVRFPFLLLALFIPAFTAGLAYRWTKDARITLWAMVLSMASGFFLPYLPAVDAFTPMMLLGAGYFLLLLHAPMRPRRAFLLGLVSGLIHLTRNEGPLWLLVAILALGFTSRGRVLRTGLALAMGYLLVLLPWWTRNLLAFGTPFPASLDRLLWLTHYNDLFLYPPQQLSFPRWWHAGPETWFALWRQALSVNLQTTLAVQAEIAGFPWLLWGLWARRRDLLTRVWLGLYLGLLATMTLVFPAPGARGGFFHAVAGLQPLTWVLIAQGMERFFAWGKVRRGWHAHQAHWILGGGLGILLLALTLVVTSRRLRTWNTPEEVYTQVAQVIRQRVPQVRPCPILVNDPPSWAWGRPTWPALVVPSGGREAVAAAARDYGACLLLLEPNHPPELRDWYRQPQDWGPFHYLTSYAGTHIFIVKTK